MAFVGNPYGGLTMANAAESTWRGPGSPSEGIGRWWNNINGTTANNMFNAQQAEAERMFNAAESAKQRAHELYMSNTAYQRAAADMRAAGINPATLSGLASGGQPAAGSSSSAASASHAASASSSGPGGIIQSLIGLVGMLGVGALRERTVTKQAYMQHNSKKLLMLLRHSLNQK